MSRSTEPDVGNRGNRAMAEDLYQALHFEADLNILLHGTRNDSEGTRSFLECEWPQRV